MVSKGAAERGMFQSRVVLRKGKELQPTTHARTSNASWAQTISDRQRDVILSADVKDLVPVCVRKVLLHGGSI
jgi:hypothetical protein